jgi:hypothetical protein
MQMGLFDWLKRKSPTAPAVNTWKIGDRVLAKWNDSYFYPGVIRDLSANTCLVVYDDGDGAWVHFAHILQPDIHVGCRVFCRARGGPAFIPGTVRQQKGETILVRYDHGEEEWTSLSMVRVQRPIANVNPDSMAGPAPAPTKQSLDLGDPVKDTNWRVGDRVLARWLDFFWYPGTILGMGERGVHILYDDGDQRVVQEKALMPLAVEEGEELFIRPKTEQQRIYTPATVLRVQGEGIDVELEDGTRENNTRVARARFWRCPVGIAALPFEEGDRVLAFDSDDCLYPAEIVTIHGDRITVQYLDGPERMLTPELIKRFDLRPGMNVECRWSGGPNHFPGKIDKIEGERVHIEYDDGEDEWTTIRLVRIPAKRPV